MTAQKIKELLDKYKEETYKVNNANYEPRDIFNAIGFQDCADEFLLPLVDALENISNMESLDGTIARQALNTLAQKLGGEG